MLVGATIAVAIWNTVEADKPRTAHCFNGGSICSPDKKTCESSAGFVKGEDKKVSARER